MSEYLDNGPRCKVCGLPLGWSTEPLSAEGDMHIGCAAMAYVKERDKKQGKKGRPND